VIEKDFTRLLQEEDEYIGKGSGFTLECIDELLLYKYTHMSESSYIKNKNKNSHNIRNKKTVINPQNTDQQCFKWTILTKYVDEYRNQIMFLDEEHYYD
jgi:hypothetical protein